jgi:drug/metabolite transporter, DME family
MNARRGAAMVLAAAALWATLGPLGKLLYEHGLSPAQVASARAALGLLGLALWGLRRPAALRIRLRDLPFFALYGLVSVALFHWLYLAAIERTDVAIAAALLYTAPAFVILLARVFEGEPLDARRLTTLGLVLLGVLLVTGAARALHAGTAPVSAAAIALGLGAGLTYGLYTIFGKRALRRHDPVPTVLWAFVFGALALAVVEPPWRPFLAAPAAVPWLLAVGIGPTIAAYLLYIGGLRHLRAGTAALLATAEPVIAAGLGILLLREAFGFDQGVGLALIVAGAVVMTGGRADRLPTSDRARRG